MFGLPASTAVNRPIPKQKFYEQLDVTAKQRRLFVDQVAGVFWRHKLSPETLNLAAGNRSFEVARTLVKKGERVTMVDVMGRLLERGRAEGITLGRMEGRMEGREQLLFSLVDDGLLSPGVAAAKANMSEAEFRARMERDRQDRQKGQ